MQQPTTSHSFNSEKSKDIRTELGKYLRYWPWFIVSIIVALIIANVYLRYTPFSYQTTAKILIKDENSSSMSQLAMFQDLGIGDKFSANLENEIEILSSRNLINRVVRQLHLNIRYFSDGRVQSQELFKDSPINLQVLTLEENWPSETPNLYITPISLTEFRIAEEESEGEIQVFGESFTYNGLEYKINATEALRQGNTTRVSISSIGRTIDGYRASLQISVIGKQSSIIAINHVSHIPKKSRAIVDELIYQFNLDAIKDRTLISENTADFIDDRLKIVWGELDSVELNKVQYKESNQMVDLKAEGGLYLENASDFNKRLIEVQTELSQIKAMISHLEAGGQSNLLPANIGIGDSGLNSLIQQYNQLVLERNKLLVHSTESHPSVVSLTAQLVNLKSNVLQSLRNIQGSLNIKSADLRRQERTIGSQLAGIPLKERDFTTIERQQEIKQSLYIYLLQKREETSIALAVTEQKAKIVDFAYTPLEPIAPKKMFILLAAVIFGGLIPLSIIYIGSILDNKVHSRMGVTNAIPNASILAEIPKLSKKDSHKLIQKNDLDILAESFRVLQSNLQFAGILERSESGKVILVTSSIKGEGKTMIAINLAVTMAHAGNKVLIVGADIRNPQLSRFFSDKQNKDAKGLVEYIVYKNSVLADYCSPSNISTNLHILQSGAIPPNPTELLRSHRLKEMLEEAKEQYDYVIIDTAPVLLVTDTMLFSNLADATLYVTRAGYTHRNILNFARDIKNDKKLKRVHYILNDVSEVNYGYGGKYGYGYGYHLDKKSFWRRLKDGLFG